MTVRQEVDDTELVVACTLGKAGLETQARGWRALRERAQVRQIKTPDGKRVCFRADDGVVDELADLVAVESRCCTWAKWEVEPRKREVVLHVTSTAHGVDTIHRMFEDSPSPTRAACCVDCR